MIEWQPIETAPKDGSRIIAYGEGPWGDVEVFTCMWNDYLQGWISSPNEATEAHAEVCKVTHWMPLPEPPK